MTEETKTAEEPHPIHEKWNQIWRTGQRPDLNGEQHVWEAMKEYAEFRLTQQQEINAELQDWKAAQIKLTLPLQEFMHAHPELKYGDQAHEKAIEFIKEREELKKQNAELVEAMFLLKLLNAELDKYWNGSRSEFQIRTIEEVQKKSGKLISKHTT